ncbi:MAG: hypothetical protein GVY25_09850 [Bacteroidetes bacterium]|nr:hypothetical protein [Bacteroidota bacterium]
MSRSRHDRFSARSLLTGMHGPFHSVCRSVCAVAFLVGSILCAFSPQVAQAQKRYAAFAHGISFGDDRPSGGESVAEVRAEKASRWENSGTPDDWKSTGLITDFTLLRYFDRDLYGGNRDKTLDNTRSAMMERFVNQMRDKTAGVSDAEWVLVGHSQGGIVVRLLYKYIQENHSDIDVAGVMAVGSPLQGARAARMAYSPSRPNYYDVAPEMRNFLKNVLRGPIADTIEDGIARIGYQPYGGYSWVELGSNFIDYYGLIADGISRIAADTKIDDRIDAMSYDKRGAEAIGPGGNLINMINSGQQPDRYRSIIGAERHPIPARVGSGAVTGSPLGLAWLPPSLIGAGALASDQQLQSLGLLFIGVGATTPDEVAPGDEPTTVRFYYNVMSMYNLLEQFYDSEQGPPLYLECWDGDGYNPCAREDRWNKGHDALKAFPDTYSEIIDSYKLESRTGYRTVCPNTYDNGTNLRQNHRFSPPSAQKYVDYYLEPPDNDDPNDPNQDDDDGVSGNECYEEAYTYYVSVPDDSDGIVTVEAGVWSENDRPNDRRHNFLFGDGGGSANKTGFNHAEVVYNERRFNSYQDPDPYSVTFYSGQENPPMQNAENWVRETGRSRN